VYNYCDNGVMSAAHLCSACACKLQFHYCNACAYACEFVCIISVPVPVMSFALLLYIHRSTSGGDRIRRESSSSQEAPSRKDRHRPGPSDKGMSYSAHDTPLLYVSLSLSTLLHHSLL